MTGLDREAADLLDKLSELGARPYNEIGVLRARAAVAASTWMQGEKAPIASVRDILLEGPAGRLPARVFHPRPDVVLPLIVYLHGGGWVAGSVAVADRPCRALALASECVVVSVDYRLAPETPFPGPLQDCVAAMRWLVEHAGQLGCSAENFAVVGDSAGGNLAAATTLALRDNGGPPPAHQVLLYPCLAPSHDDTLYPSRQQNAEGYQLTRADMAWFWEHYLARGSVDADAGNPYAAPLLASRLNSLAPATIVTAGFDPLRDEAAAYADRLRDEGVPVELACWQGTIHGSFWMAGELSAGRELIDYTATMLRRALHGDAP